MMPPMLRAFAAIPIPDTVSAYLDTIRRRVGPGHQSVRWVGTGNLHLTLKFFGNVDAGKVPEIVGQLDAATAAVGPFQLRTAGTGVFPNRRRARVLWVGLAGDLDRLHLLRNTLESGLEAVGFDRDSRRFHPHLTLCRARGRIDAKMLDRFLETPADTEAVAFCVNRILLVQSVLKPTGAVYTTLHASHLSGPVSVRRNSV